MQDLKKLKKDDLIQLVYQLEKKLVRVVTKGDKFKKIVSGLEDSLYSEQNCVTTLKIEVKDLKGTIDTQLGEVADLKVEIEKVEKEVDDKFDIIESIQTFLNQVLGKCHLYNFTDLLEARKEAQYLNDTIK